MDSADGSTERALKEATTQLRQLFVEDSADGSTERALKEQRHQPPDKIEVDSADGSTERALKGRHRRRRVEQLQVIQQTAQQREH